MTTFTSDRALKGVPVAGVGDGGSLKIAYGSIDVAVNPVADDIYEMCRIPAGATIVGGWFRGDRLDTNATETLDLDVGTHLCGGDFIVAGTLIAGTSSVTLNTNATATLNIGAESFYDLEIKKAAFGIQGVGTIAVTNLFTVTSTVIELILSTFSLSVGVCVSINVREVYVSVPNVILPDREIDRSTVNFVYLNNIIVTP